MRTRTLSRRKDREEEDEIADGSEYDKYVRYGTREKMGAG